MVTMWPRALPQEVLDNPLRSAEIKVFNKLAELLGDDFTVYYSRPWMGLTPTGAERDGECDFLISHPTAGILALEVKGGAIAYNPSLERWTSTDRHGFVHKIKDPIYQARTSKHTLLKKLKETKKWRARNIRAHHGVVFPDSDSPPTGLRADAPRELFCCRNELPQLDQWIARRMELSTPLRDGEERLGADGNSALEAILASPFTLKVPLGHWLSEDDVRIESLTPQQFHILEAITDVPRAGVAGGAGTGKTVLAVEDARRYAQQGRRVLLTCHSQPLAEELGRRIRRVAPAVETGTFHEMCMRVADKAGLRFQVAQTRAFFHETLPELLTRAMDRRPELRWDTIIVDEGQDFELVWWIALDSALAHESAPRLHVFYDCNQRVYERGGRPPDDVMLTPIRLTRNLRNTKAIHNVAMKHYDGIEILPNNVEGQKIEAVPLQPGEIGSWVNSRVRQLVGRERVPPGTIAVLHSGQIDSRVILQNGLLGGQPVCGADKLNEDDIVFDSIRRFKGLERGTIVLLATPDLLRQIEAAYIAASRAKVHLIIGGDAASVDWVLSEAVT